jgi:hypothetical protein
MFEIQDAAKAAFKASPGLYPIINGIVRDEDEDTVEINLNLLAIDLYKARDSKWCTSLKRYADEVKEAFEYYIEELRNNAVELFVGTYTGEFPSLHSNLSHEFGDYVRDWIKNNGDGDELKDIAYSFVVYDDGKSLITNQDESKLV